MLTLTLLLIAGLAALVVGGDLLVRGASSIARRLGVSPLLIGLTLVGFGTSTPELVTSLQAAFAGAPGVAIGNVVGSNTANILLILGVAALVFPVAVSPASFKRDGLVLAASALLCLAVVMAGRLSLPVGAFFVVCLLAYLVFSIHHERKSPAPPTNEDTDHAVAGSPALDAGIMLGGLVLTVLGARWFVTGAIDLASRIGVSETVIGLTLVAVGTSLPELVTSVMASLRRQGGIAFGNIIGSNIYNVFFILGVTAMVKPIEIPPAIAGFDIWVMLAATAALAAVAITGWRVARWEGGVLLAFYVAYIAWLGRTAF